jgi:signal transduction histidine kinase
LLRDMSDRLLFASLRCLVKRPTDVFAVLEEIVRLIAPQAEQQGVEINLRLPESHLARVMLDAEKFKQAILNLVINALEAMPAGGELLLCVSTGDSELVIEIADTWSGIPVEIQHQIAIAPIENPQPLAEVVYDFHLMNVLPFLHTNLDAGSHA